MTRSGCAPVVTNHEAISLGVPVRVLLSVMLRLSDALIEIARGGGMVVCGFGGGVGGCVIFELFDYPPKLIQSQG